MAVAVIPARFGSSRLPGKPLLQLAGRPMVAHVVRAALLAPSISTVLVATDHEGIAAAAREAGARAVMTDSALPSGTDRVEAALRLSGIDAPIIVNVQGACLRRCGRQRMRRTEARSTRWPRRQTRAADAPMASSPDTAGDEPFIDPASIDLAAQLLLSRPSAHMSTLSAPLSASELLDPTKVKIVCRDAPPALTDALKLGSFGSGGPLLAGHYSPAWQRERDEARRAERRVASPAKAVELGGDLGVGAPAARLALFFSRAPIGVDRDALARLLHPLSAGSAVPPSSPSGGPHDPVKDNRGGAVSVKDNSGSAWLPAPAAFASRLHVGVYGFRRAALSRFVSLPRSELEGLESLEQMRAVQAGWEIVVGEVSHASRGVDTIDDLRAARQRLGGGSGGNE